jgi:hypothetical protein
LLLSLPAAPTAHHPYAFPLDCRHVRYGHVHAGQLLGKVGHSGDARGGASHLHFGISWPTAHGRWWARRGEVYPWPYLDAWRAGHDKSPAKAVRAKHAKLGDRGCTTDC